MAIWACNNPLITISILSCEITKLVVECAKEAVTRILEKRKTDAEGPLVTLSAGEGGGGVLLGTILSADMPPLNETRPTPFQFAHRAGPQQPHRPIEFRFFGMSLALMTPSVPSAVNP